MKRLALAAFAACVTILLLHSPASAKYPEKAIQIVVPAKAGGSSDLLARMFQKAFKEGDLLGAPLAIVNVPGAGLSIGSRRVKDAKPDGYTFLLTHVALLSRQASGLSDFGYKDFEPVAQSVGFCVVAAVRDDSPYKTLGDLLKDAKGKPDTVIFGANLGALNHMAGLTLQGSSAGSVLRFVQIGGGAKTYAALKGEHIQLTTFGAPLYNKFRNGGVRGLAILSDQRHPRLADLPTAKEQGFDANFCVDNFWFAPKGTPQAAIDHFAGAVEKALATEAVKKQLRDGFSTPSFLKGAAFKAKLEKAYDRIAPIAKRATKK
jgi:putative tricarboxylic transport membrane protein